MSILHTNNVEIYYEESGRGVPILWLQGLGADHSAWSPQIARFSARYRCLAPDNRGAGRTAPSGPFDLRTLAVDSAALLADCTPAEPAHVVGLSMGASVAQELALLAPERV